MDLESELLKSISRDELEVQLAEKIASFHGFLTRDVALRLIAREKGLLKSEEKVYRLGEIPKGGKRITFRAHVKKIWPVALYSSGKKSRVVEVQDESGEKPLVLWNDDVALASRLRAKDEISVRGAYEKNGELHLGYSGSLEVLKKAAFTKLDELSEGQVAHLRGFVSRVEGFDSFVRGMGTIRGFSFVVSDGENERRCLILGGMGRSERIRKDDEVIIENGAVRNGNIEIDAHARILSRRSKEMLLGEITRMDCEGEKLLIRVGEKDAVFGREGALRFLGVSAAPDIALSTVVRLKKGSLLNSRIALRIGEMDGKTTVR